MNILAAILAALQTVFGTGWQGVIVGFPVFLVQAVLTLAEDEKTIFLNALNVVIADIKAGKAWETAYTDMLNSFYSGEQTEGGKIAMAVLEWLAKAVGSLFSTGAHRWP